MNGPYAPDPRNARCQRWQANTEPPGHTFRDRNFTRDGVTRCIHCGRRKGERRKRSG